MFILASIKKNINSIENVVKLFFIIMSSAYLFLLLYDRLGDCITYT